VKAFVTVGLDRKPFSRLLRLVDLAVGRQLLSRETLVQRGHTEFSSRNLQVVQFLPFADMQAAARKAELVITHAGVGSILLCQSAGQLPLVFPRQGDLGEHVDNHQLEFAEVMAAAGKAVVAYNEVDFFSLLARVAEWRQGPPLAQGPDPEPELAATIKSLLAN